MGSIDQKEIWGLEEPILTELLIMTNDMETESFDFQLGSDSYSCERFYIDCETPFSGSKEAKGLAKM